MKYYSIWKLFAAMLAVGATMTVFLFLFIFYSIPWSREIAFGAMIVNFGLMAILVIKLKPYFKQGTEQSSSTDKPWRSYSRSEEKKSKWKFW